VIKLVMWAKVIKLVMRAKVIKSVMWAKVIKSVMWAKVIKLVMWAKVIKFIRMIRYTMSIWSISKAREGQVRTGQPEVSGISRSVAINYLAAT
jgi:hypothetical protein